MSSQTCYHCIYYGPRKQDPHVQDWWCHGFGIPVLNDAPKCPNFKKRDGPEGSVNASYLGYVKREEDRKLEEKKRQGDADKKHKAIIITQVVIAVAMFLTVAIGFRGVQIQKDTQEIVKETQKITAESSIPNKANLVIFTNAESDDLTFNRSALADKYTYGARLDVRIQNRGRSESGRIKMWWNSTSNSSFKIWDSYESISNLEGGEIGYKMLGITCSECWDYYAEHPDEKPNETLINLVPKGILELELIVECPQCTPDQYITPKNFTICIYDNPEECKSFST